jgi:hypothetical protein
MAALLAKYYSFGKIPDEWIQIGRASNKPRLTGEIKVADIKEIVEEDVQLPVKDIYKLETTIQVLKKYYSFSNIPNSLIDIVNAPEIEWDIFN